MTLSRLLLLPRFRSGINSVEYRRWYSLLSNTGEVSQPLKKSEVIEQQKVMGVEILEKKYMDEDEGAFPQETHVQKEVGPWNNLVAILQRTKEKFLGDHMEQKSCSTRALIPTSDLKDADNVVSTDSQDSGNMNILKITNHSERTSVAHKEENVGSETAQPSYADMSEALEEVKMKDGSNSVGPEELLNVSSKECEVSSDNMVNSISSGVSSICVEANSKESVQLVKVCHRSELVEKEPLLPEEVPSNVQISSGGEILSKSAEACIVRHQMQVKIPVTSDEVSANKCNSTTPENQQENIMEACKLLSNLNLGKTDTSCGSGRVASVVDVPQEKRDDGPNLEAKNDNKQRGKVVVSEICSVFENKKSNLQQGAQSNGLLLSEATKKWGDALIKSSDFFSNESPSAEDISKSILLSKSEEILSVSNNSFQLMRLGDHSAETDHRAIDQIVNPKSEQSVPGEFEPLNRTSQTTFIKSSDIKSLIECIRELPPQEISAVRAEEFVRNREGGANSGIQAKTDMQSFDRKMRNTSSQGVVRKKENSRLSDIVLDDINSEGERIEIGDTAPHDCSKSIETKENASLGAKIDPFKSKKASLSENLLDKNKVTIKFVDIKATETEVLNSFKDCGDIMKVVFQNGKWAKYKVAHIYFMSEKGRQKALGKSDVLLMGKGLLVATSPPEGRDMRIPDLIGYPEVPTSLVKHPSRTAMIRELKHNVSFHDIEEALAFWKSNITGIFFGSSSSVAYVEFKTVEDKEIALEKQNVVVLGDKLPILRIDAPRTTVIQISNVNSLPMSKVVSVCTSLGKTSQFFQRGSNMVHVHFKFSEWPRMLEILNRLNGVKVDGQHLVAKPAPVYPPAILHALWSQPEGRRYLKTVCRDMLLNLGGNGVDKDGITELVDNLYADAPER